MKFSIAIVGAFAALGLAKPAITNLSFNLVEGQPFTLEWINATGPVTVDLVTGPNSGSLTPVRVLATGETDGSFTFTPSGLASGNYAFRVTDSDSDPNFSILFPYTGTAASSSGSVSSTRSTTRTTTGASSTPVSSAPSSSLTTEASSTTSRATSTRTTATTTPTTTRTNNNEGQRFSSSLALVFMTVAALVFFN